MAKTANNINIARNYNDGFKKRYYLLISLSILFILLVTNSAWAKWPQVTTASDGTPISYQTYGAGDTTLIFVHGWSCDARYWQKQLDYFADKYTVVTVDLAGHGHSVSKRSNYTMKAFGEDVKAVASATYKKGNLILIGHSMGGAVIVEAAALMPGKVKGLIGVDTLENIEHPMTKEEYTAMLAPLKKEFKPSVKSFVKDMLGPDNSEALETFILSDMSSAPSDIAVSAMENYLSPYVDGTAGKIFKSVRIPVVLVNADKWPINYKANRKHMASFDAIVIKKADHFLMMNRAKEFNSALDKAIGMVLTKTPNQK